ncbi:MarR family winged helix-turn-helix transcriptional regulator [Fulvivirga ligni]|uniref:MarR family winged helix-turn-helix transcriptional regulator n=1 Tax=Fulvivirga ligni TaxID=2904246 RepID=UPI001F3260B0|nr:MarR family transcriptional regulator [Fulvivirga ligni]UII20328.1 MarR family transcriptional regulator [Fulvivirga ligni]
MKFEEEIQQKKFKCECQKATLNLIFTSGWLNNKHKDFFKPYNITNQQYNVLRILRGQHPDSISTSVIKERMLDKNSDVSRIVDRLTLKGWVKKTTCPDDRRLVDVVITDEGLQLLEKMDKSVDQMNCCLGSLTEQEARQLSELLDKVRD